MSQAAILGEAETPANCSVVADAVTSMTSKDSTCSAPILEMCSAFGATERLTPAQAPQFSPRSTRLRHERPRPRHLRPGPPPAGPRRCPPGPDRAVPAAGECGTSTVQSAPREVAIAETEKPCRMIDGKVDSAKERPAYASPAGCCPPMSKEDARSC